MYKVLIFIHKSKNSDFKDYFVDNLLGSLSKMMNKEIRLAKVESNLLLDKKYDYFCELQTESRNEMDSLFNSPEGREISKKLQESFNDLTLITVNYAKS